MNFDEVINRLNERKSIHPNISSIWTHYLNIKKQKLEKAILDAQYMLSISERIEQDITPEMIYLMLVAMSNGETDTDTNTNII